MCNPGLRERHWAQMSEVVGFNLSYDDTHTSLSKLLDRRVEEKMDQLQELSDIASREFSFEKMLIKMQASRTSPASAPPRPTPRRVLSEPTNPVGSSPERSLDPALQTASIPFLTVTATLRPQP